MEDIENMKVEDDYVLKELLRIFEPKENEDRTPGYAGAAILAADVGVTLFNLFRSLQIGQGHRHLRAVRDLCFTLNDNAFWQQHAPRIMPVVQMALNSHMDKIAFSAEKGERHDLTVYDPFIISGRMAPLEVFSTIALCLGGNTLMVTSGAEIKRSLSRYFSKD